MAALAVLMVGSSALTVVAANTKPTIDIVTLGDSYAAGTGGSAYYGKAGCYRSSYSYGEEFRDKLRIDYDTTHENLACNGAETKDLLSQAADLSAARRYTTDLVLLSIGVNDLDFIGVVTQCLIGVTDSFSNCLHNLEQASDGMAEVKTDTYEAMKKLATLFFFAP